MPHTNAIPENTEQKAQKARMLISILGTDFTRKSRHPFFRNLTEAATKPVSSSAQQPDISRALRNLMSQLSARGAGQEIAPPAAKTPRTFSSETYLSEDQHPALIASALAKLPNADRQKTLRSLSGPLACRVLVFLREIEARSTSTPSPLRHSRSA
ncbi:MAG: hypothetical protein ABJ327_01265 [Litoreibacter sp.]